MRSWESHVPKKVRRRYLLWSAAQLAAIVGVIAALVIADETPIWAGALAVAAVAVLVEVYVRTSIRYRNLVLATGLVLDGDIEWQQTPFLHLREEFERHWAEKGLR